MPAGHRHRRDHLPGEARRRAAAAGPCSARACRRDVDRVEQVAFRGGHDIARAGLNRLTPPLREIAQNGSASASQSPHLPRTSITGRGAEKPALLRRLAHAARQAVVVDVHGLPARVADQEDAVVQAIGMLVGDIGVGAFDPAGEVLRRRTGRGSDRRCWPRPAGPAPSRPLRRCHRRSPACRSPPAPRTPRRACRSTARPGAVSRSRAAAFSESPS